MRSLPDAPHVTSIIRILDKPGLVKWAGRVGAESGDPLEFERLRVAASQRGQDIHEMCLTPVAGKDYSAYAAEWRGWNMFLHDKQPHIIAAEQSVRGYVHGLPYVGRFDAVMNVRGKRFMVDLKTGGYINQTEVRLQLAAYRHAEDAPRTSQAAVLKILPDAYDFIPVPAGPTEFGQFGQLRRVYEWAA